jgi:hypothetical protein
MRKSTDRLSASRICEMTGVKPQTRSTWVDRELLADSDNGYGELDAIELAILDCLLATIDKKSHVNLFWEEAQARLRSSVLGPAAVLVWDPESREHTIVSDVTQLRAAVCHGRPVQAIPIGELAARVRRTFRRDVKALARADNAKAAKAGKRKPGRSRGA